MSGKLFLVFAPSGAGKTTIINYLLSDFKSNLKNNYNLSRAVTYTTRIPRLGEINGEDYYFLSETEFKKKIEENFFLEWSNVYGAYYGSAKGLIEDLKIGKSYILIVDHKGVKEIIKIYSEAILIRISPPSFEELVNRLTKRSTENIKEIENRLAISLKEMQDCEIPGINSFNIVNNRIETAAKELIELIIKEIEIKR